MEGRSWPTASPTSAAASQDAPSRPPLPRRRGVSSSTVNLLWGLFNLAVAYVLVCRVGQFGLRNTLHVLALGAGMAVIAVLSAHSFGRFHGGS